MEPIEYLWKDRKRFWGMPLSFTRYSLSEDRLFCETGLLNMKSDEVLLYRVRDLRLTMNLFPDRERTDSQKRGGGQGSAPHPGHRAAGRRGRRSGGGGTLIFIQSSLGKRPSGRTGAF